MTIGAMQPYFFPYLGYFQLLNAIDTFVVLDDVNFIKKGFINKNSILLNRKIHKIILPVAKISQNRLISEHQKLQTDTGLLETIMHAYKKAPYYTEIMPLLEELVTFPESRLSVYLTYQLKTICSYLNIETRFIYSSEIVKPNEANGQDRIIAICKELKAKHYVNPIGGRDLYSNKKFNSNGIKISFIKTEIQPYKQFNNVFFGSLSIIDVLMFNSKSSIANMLNQYTFPGSSNVQ